MKFRVLFLSVIFLCLFLIQTRRSRQETKWKGTIEEKNGVKVIKNHKEPLYGEIEFELEEVLSIGRENDEEYILYLKGGYNAINIALDSNENIYVLDNGNFRVQKFDKKGNYLCTIGRKGKGPGEFESPSSFYIDEKDILYVLDIRKLKLFNRDGEFKKDIPLEVSIRDFFVTLNEDILASVISTKEQKEAIIKMNLEGKIIDYLTDFADLKLTMRKGSNEGSYLIFSATHNYTPRSSLSVLNGQNFVYGFPLKYELCIADYEGNLELKFLKKEPHQSISKSEKNKIINELKKGISRKGMKWPEEVIEAACRFPPYRPFFDRILVDDCGRIFVRKLKSIFESIDKIEFDVFNKDGYFIHRTILPFSPEIIKNGYLYDKCRLEDTGEVRIKKYKVKNWEQIRH